MPLFTIRIGWTLLAVVLCTVLAPLFSTNLTLVVLILVGLVAGVIVGERLNYGSGYRLMDRGLEDFPTSLYVVLFGFVVVVAVVVRYYGLDEIKYVIDEHHHVDAARRYLEGSTFPFRSFVGESDSKIYDRSWIYTVQVAEAFRFLGDQQYSGRLVSLVWGMLLLVPTYLMARILDFSRFRTLILLWWVSVSSFFVTMSRWLRMYPMFVTVCLLWIVCLYYFFSAEDRSDEMIFGGLSLLLGVLSLHLHLLTVTVLPAILVYWLSNQPVKAKTWAGLAVFLLVGLLGFAGYAKGWQFLALGDQFVFKHLYVSFLVHEPFGWVLGGLFLGAGVLAGDKSEARRYVLILIGVTLGFFVFFTGRYMAYRYVSHLIVLSYFPIAWGLFTVVDRFFARQPRWRFGLLLVIGVLLPVWELWLWLPDLVKGSMGSLYSHLRILKILS